MSRGQTSVYSARKPPKLRFQPGSFVEYKGQLYEILYAFRVASAPQEWFYTLAERESLTPPQLDLIGAVVEALGAGRNTPRVVYEVFPHEQAAWSYFSDIPRNGDCRCVGNRAMMKDAKVVSSGQVLP